MTGSSALFADARSIDEVVAFTPEELDGFRKKSKFFVALHPSFFQVR
ncbi:MAG: hypothetical protein R2860_12375 [Desulfobacterales bacterium]